MRCSQCGQMIPTSSSFYEVVAGKVGENHVTVLATYCEPCWDQRGYRL